MNLFSVRLARQFMRGGGAECLESLDDSFHVQTVRAFDHHDIAVVDIVRDKRGQL